MCDTIAMYITNIEKEGPFLKIWGQVDKKAATDVERALYRASALYEEGKHLLNPGNLLIGVLCCAKYIDEKYYRARIINVDTYCQGTVEVNFIDYGNKDLVRIENLRCMDCFNSTFITLPPLALPFIVSEVVCIGGEWNDISLEQISREIRYIEVKYKITSTHLGYQVIMVYLAKKDLALHLVQNKLMQSIPLETQESLLTKMIPRTPQVLPAADQSLLQYKSFTLEPNSQHEVYVSYITDGPCHFSVQLKKSESILVQLMREINSIPLKPFEELPIPGTVCLAKCVEDSHICRAVITSEVDNQYKLFYVDFGNTEIVPPDNLYQMPFKYIIPKIMAIRLSLDGIDKSTVTLEMQCAFKQFVDNRLLMMEVFPSAKKMALPKCRMWDPDTNTDVMEILNKAAQLAFPNVIALHRGLTRPVKVTFVYSCNKFYIHLKSNEDELSQLMANIQVYCNSTTASFLEQPRVGQPCCAEFKHDGQWYRGLIVTLNEDSAKVKYIDYGNEEDVQMQSLKTIEGEFLTCMRPQAIECCLNGYQNMTEDLERDNKLEELILDQEFTMKVIDIVSSKSLVDLIDSNGRSVTALLMEAMINQTKIQVIANGNVENTTSKYGSANVSKKNGKPYGEQQWSASDKSQNRKEKSEDWRQGSRKRNGSLSNDTTESWRQKSNKNDHEWHDNTSNESFRNGRTNNESRKSANTNLRYDGKYRNNRNEFRNQNNSWSPPEKDKSSHNQNSYSNSQDNHTEWNGKEASNDRNRFSRQENEGLGHKENRNKPKNDNWNNDNSTYTWGENEEFQGVKKRTKNFSANNSNNRNRDRSDNEEWGNKKNSFNGNDSSEKKSYRDRNSYDSDSSYKKGKQERNFDGKPRFDRGDSRKKPYKNDHDYRSTDHEQTDGRKFNSRSESKWTDSNNSNNVSYNNSCNTATAAIDPAPDNATFQTLEVSGQQKVTMSWFHNPCSFFCQLMDSQQNFNSLMDEIQEMYKDKPSSFAVEGAPAIALFPEDNVFYRSTILKSMGNNKYKVYYVDFGNISVVDSVWPIDKKFMELPMQAIPCGLGGIIPVGNDWPDPNAFTNYMQKDSLDCEFLSYETDRYMVNLYSNNQDIKQQLVDNNLAKYVETSVPLLDYDINLLAAHTFRAELESVNDLSDFTMSLSWGIQLLCSAHNLAHATETFEDELKQKIGQVLVVYCDNIVENRLEVTLYDHIGNKLNILNPDEGAFDTIESVCPHLLIDTKVEGFVSFVNETSIVIQPSQCAERLQSLLNDIYEHYESLPQESPIIPEEGFIYAVRCDDSNWYRGRVTSFDDEKVTVMYVDYGNSEDVPFANLRELDPKFYWWDRMAILVQVNVPTADLFEKQVKALVHYNEEGLEGEILEVQDTYVPEEQPENTNVNLESETSNQTQEAPEIVENTCDTTVPVSGGNEIAQDVANSFHEANPCEQNVVDGTPVVLSHIDSPSDFYIQLSGSQNAISELQSKIQQQIDEMPVLENTSIGGLCAAPYSVDQMWYRSQILDADEDITTVRFIDYGNTDVIDNKATQIKTLPAEFLALEEYARRCRLKIKPLEEEWSKATTSRFEELAYVENVTVQFINQDEKANYVELYSDGQNVKDLLIAENLAVLDEGLILDAKLKGYISHMNSPSEFWVQLDGWCSELEWIAEQLSNAASFPDLEDFTPGSLCAAMFPDDEMWYRARILSNTVAGLEVLFLDYGNSCVCGNLKQLPEHLVMAPPLALKCSLQKPEGLFNWSPEAVQKFAELSADGQTEFTVKKLTTGETSMVELYVNNEEVSSKLLPTTDDVYVTDIKSMDNFAASKEGTISDERYRLENIPGCEYNQECLNKFVEINNEGKTCYGMEYLSDNTVRLYLNGNDIRSEFLPIIKNNLSQSPVVTFDESQSENLEISEICDTPQTNDIYETIQEVTPEVCDRLQAEESLERSNEETSQVYEPQEEKEIQGEATEICETPVENEIPETTQEVDEFCDTPQTTEIHETIPEDVSKVCDTSQAEVIHDVSQEETSQIFEPQQEKQIREESQLEASEMCETSLEKEIHEVSQEALLDMSLEEDIQEADLGANELHETPQANEIHETSQEGAPEVSQDETCQDKEIHEESQEASEICNAPLEKEIHEVSQEALSDMSLEEDIEGADLGADELHETPQANEIHETSQDDEIHEVSQEALLDMSLEEDIQEADLGANELHETPQANEIHETSQEGAPDVSQDETYQDKEIHEEAQEASEICNTSLEKEIHEVSQESSLDTSLEKGIQEADLHEANELHKTTQANEIHEESQEEASAICNASPKKEIHETDLKEANEFCDTSQIHEIPQEKKIHEVDQEKSSKACDISQIESSYETQDESTKVRNTVETSETHDIVSKQIPQNCDTTETKGISQDANEACHTSHKGKIDEVAENDVSCGNQKQENLEVCDSPKSKEIHDIAHGEISGNCDIEEKIEVITPQTKEINEVVQERTCEMSQEKEIHDINIEEISGNCDEKEVTQDASKDCETTEAKETKEIAQEKVSEVCDTLHEKVLQEIEEVDKEPSEPCDKLQAIAVSVKVCDIPKHSLPIDSSNEAEASEANSKLEFTETIMTSFSAPTVSEKESVPKLSPTKVTPRVQEGPEKAADH